LSLRGAGGKPLGAAGWAARAAANKAAAAAASAAKAPRVGGTIIATIRILSQALRLADAAVVMLGSSEQCDNHTNDQPKHVSKTAVVAADALAMLETDAAAMSELGLMVSVPEAVAQVSAACVILSAGRGAPKMTDDLSWGVTRTHLENSSTLLRKLRRLDLAEIATHELVTYLERNYLDSKLFDPDRYIFTVTFQIGCKVHVR
jgi:hypothetical protein